MNSLDLWPPAIPLFADIQIFVDPRWGAAASDYKLRLNEAEAHQNPNLDLCSRSHTHHLGGFAVSRSPQIKALGFDLETRSRVHAAVAARICRTADERAFAEKSPAIFWSAKEAAFKALRSFRQPTTVSQVEVGRWVKAHSHYDSFEVLNCSDFESVRLRGLAWSEGEYCFAVVLG